MKRSLLLCALLATAAVASAQVLQVQPPNPTSIDNVIVHVATFIGGMDLQPVVYSGSEIRITFRGFSVFPCCGQIFAVPLGRLAPGNYSIIVTFVFAEGDEEGFTVTQPPVALAVTEGAFVPTLSDLALLALALALAIAGTFR